VTPAPGVRRWPLHPPPGPGESLTSWLARLAALYGMPASQMLRHNLGEASVSMFEVACTDVRSSLHRAQVESPALRLV
jgi:hypothetical protein